MSQSTVIRQPYLLPGIQSSNFTDDQAQSYIGTTINITRSTVINAVDFIFRVDFSNTARHITTAVLQYSLSPFSSWTSFPATGIAIVQGVNGSGFGTIDIQQTGIVPPVWDTDFRVRALLTDVFGRQYTTDHITVNVDFSHFNQVHIADVAGEVDSVLDPTSTTSDPVGSPGTAANVVLTGLTVTFGTVGTIGNNKTIQFVQGINGSGLNVSEPTTGNLLVSYEGSEGAGHTFNDVEAAIDASGVMTAAVTGGLGLTQFNLTGTHTLTGGINPVTGRIVQATYSTKSFVYLRPENDGSNLLGAGFTTSRVFYSTNGGASWTETTKEVLESGQTLKVPIPTWGAAVQFYVTDTLNRFRARPVSVTATAPNSGVTQTLFIDEFESVISSDVVTYGLLTITLSDPMNSNITPIF